MMWCNCINMRSRLQGLEAPRAYCANREGRHEEDRAGRTFHFARTDRILAAHHGRRARATAKAAEANDFLAAEIARRPDRYLGFAHIGLQDPAAAARELERCVKDLGFRGAMINGHTNGHYLDERQFDPFWARAEELQVPIYLHPADPAQQYATYGSYKEITRATWGWGVETGTHVLRMVFGGVFDRVPKALLLLGHLGIGDDAFFAHLLVEYLTPGKLCADLIDQSALANTVRS